jgi:hypothetical protein
MNHSSALPARRSLRRSLIGFCVIAIALFVTAVCEAGTFCAIAFSTSTGRYGHAEGWNTRAQAERRALAACGTSDARVVGWVNNGYVALAVGDGFAWGTGFGATAEIARAKALRNCRGRNARVVKCVYAVLREEGC